MVLRLHQHNIGYTADGFYSTIRLEPNISKPLEIETPLQRTTNRKWPTWNQMATWQWRHVTPKVKLVIPIRLDPDLEMLF